MDVYQKLKHLSTVINLLLEGAVGTQMDKAVGQ